MFYQGWRCGLGRCRQSDRTSDARKERSGNTASQNYWLWDGLYEAPGISGPNRPEYISGGRMNPTPVLYQSGSGDPCGRRERDRARDAREERGGDATSKNYGLWDCGDAPTRVSSPSRTEHLVGSTLRYAVLGYVSR